MPATLANVSSHLDLPKLHALAADRHDAGDDPDTIIRAVVEAVDAAVPWSALGPVGVVVDMVDGPIAEFIARMIVHAVLAGRKHNKKAT